MIPNTGVPSRLWGQARDWLLLTFLDGMAKKYTYK